MKKGISEIIGKTELKLGEKAFYKVSRVHQLEDREKVKNALWKIYVKEKGDWVELKPNPSAPPKKGNEIPLTITNKNLVGKELLVEAYIYEPEKKSPPGLKIKVLSTTEKKIQRVELFTVDDAPIKESTILKYNQTIKVKVYTLNMPKELLKLSLYEDDAEKGGHNPKNEKNKVAEVTKTTNERGFLWYEFKLNADFSKIANAMMDGSSDKLHEYYVLVESVKYGKKASKNVEVENPDYKKPQPQEEIKEIEIEEVIVKGKYKKQVGIDPMPNTGRKVAIVKEPTKEEKKTTCICKEEYKDLVWGEKVSCEFRKKVVQICAELWGESRKMEMANGLMAVMNVETSGSFKAQQVEGWRSVKNPKDMTIRDFWKKGNRKSSSAVGLIQFTQDALQNNLKEYTSNPKLTTEEKFDELNKLKLSYAQMGEIKQLNKVKKYFEPSKSTIKTPEDIYLAVFAPIGIGKSDNTTLYKKGTDYYEANESVDIKSKGVNKNDGKIQRSEILERFHDSMKEGKSNVVKTFSCNKNKADENKTTDAGYYIYLDGSIKYIESENAIDYYVQTKSGSKDFKKIVTLNKNTHGMVKIPDSGKGFNRYGTADRGGQSNGETVGSGDHYLLPSTAAALFGIIYEINEKGWELHLGDMSSENGSDPWQRGSRHHAGHGHMGRRKGLDIDFRYLNKNGVSFQGVNTSSNFDNSKNEEVYKLGHKFGFRKNYASGLNSYKKYGVSPTVGGHYDHGHFGMSNINLETVTSIDVKIIN